nr:hypothetical protein [candidate division Zixibacteria bacterium]
MAAAKRKAEKTGRAADIFQSIEKSPWFFPAFAAVMLVGVIILFRQFLFSDKMLFGSDTLNAGLFFRHFYVEYFKAHGSVPVWNPYIFGGMPFIDAFHGDTFYPLSILKFVGNFYRNLGINLVIHIYLSGLFMYFAARQFKLSKTASAVAGAGYMFAGVIVSMVAPGHDGKIFVATLFPLTILFLDRAFDRKPILNFTLLGLVIGIIILSPHPQLSYYTLWALALYGIFKLVVLYREIGSIAKVISPGVLLAAAVVIGLFLSAIQFYPGYVYTKNFSPRAESKRGYEWATSWSMHAEEAVSAAIPEFSGTSSGEGNYYWGKNAFKDNSEYAGTITLFLAMIGLFFYRKKESIFFGALALFTFIYALGGSTPFFRVFYYLIPMVKSLRAPSTIMFIFLFSMSLLAGMGVQYLLDRAFEKSSRTRKKLVTYIIAVPAVILILAMLFAGAGEGMLSLYSSIFYGNAKTAMVGQGMSKWNLALMNLPNLQTGLWLMFLFIAIVAVLIWLVVSRKTGALVFLFIPLVMMIDGVRFDSRFVSIFDYKPAFSANALTEFFSNIQGEFRVLNLANQAGVRQNYLPFFNIEVVTGYHGNQLRWYDDLLGGSAQSNLINPHFLNLVNTRYILAPQEMQLPPNYFGPDSLRLVRDFGRLKVYENDNALPRAFLAGGYEIIPERKDIYPRIMAGDRDLSRFVYLEEPLPDQFKPIDTVYNPVTIVSYANDSILINCRAQNDAILVLTDNYYRSWEAFADGRKVDILRADGSFRAVPIKAGTGQVLFKYNRSDSAPAKTVTILTLILIGAILIVNLVMWFIEKKKTVQV